MQCSHCQFQRIRKNGHRLHTDDIRQLFLRHYVNGMDFRGIERSAGVHHTTVINWVKQSEESLPDTSPDTIPDVGKLDELETVVGFKKQGSTEGKMLVQKTLFLQVQILL